MSSPADIVAQGMGLGPAGLIYSFLTLPGGGRTTGNPQNPYVGAGSMEDPYGAMQDIEVFYGAGGVEPPPSTPDVPYATPPIAPPPIAPPIASPGPIITGPNSYPVPNRPPARRQEDILRERLDRIEREAEELRRRQQRRNTQPGGKKPPPKRPGGQLGDYDDYARACLASPTLCVIGGLLWPSTAGEGSTVLKPGQTAARKRPRIKFPGKAPKIPRSFDYRDLPMPSLPGSVATGLPQKASPAKRPLPRQRALPHIVKTRPKLPGTVVSMPTMPPFPSVSGGTLSLRNLGSQLLKYAGLVIPLLQPKQRTRIDVNIPKSEPISGVPFDNPLTTVQPLSAAYPMTAVGSGGSPIVPRSGTLEDQCRQFRKRRKPKRRCIRRDDCNKCVEYEAI